MNAAHLHVALNHFPVFGSFIATGFLFFSWIKKNQDLQKAALWLFVAVAITAVPVWLTGEGAEEIAEGLPGVQKAAIEPHEEFATVTFWIIIVGGILSVLQLFLINKKIALQKTVLLLMLVVAFTVCGFTAYAAYLGGKIRHTEFGLQSTENEKTTPGANGEEPDKEPAEANEESGKKRKSRDKNR